MRYVFAFLLTMVAVLTTFVTCVFLNRVFECNITFDEFTFILVMNFMFQYYCDTLKRKN